MLRPYVPMYDDNPMYMIRHNHKSIQLSVGEMIWNIKPARLCNYAPFAQPHSIINHLTEKTGALACANRDKIHAIQIGIFRQSNRTTIMLLRIKRHGLPHLARRDGLVLQNRLDLLVDLRRDFHIKRLEVGIDMFRFGRSGDRAGNVRILERPRQRE